MGASLWVYYVPYKTDIAVAFKELRQHVFEAGEYSHFWDNAEGFESLYDTFDPETMSEDELERLEREAENFPINPPQSIEELLRRNGSQGTHSILDITSIAPQPRVREYEHVPLPQEVIEAFYRHKSGKVSREVVEAIVSQDEIWRPIEQWLTRVIAEPQYAPRAFAQRILPFFQVERSKEELIELLVSQEEVWKSLYYQIHEQFEGLAFKSLLGKAVPFSTEVLLRFFGTEKPTRKQAEKVLSPEQPGVQEQIWVTVHRGMGYYTPLYREGIPDEIVFAGRTGD